MKHLPWYTFTSVGILIMTKANALKKKKKKRKGGNKPCRPMFIGSLVWILLNMSSDFQFVNQKGAFFSNMSLVWSLMHKIVHACQACMLLCATAPLKGRVLHTSGEQSLQGRGHSSKQRVGLATKVQVWDKITWYCSVLTIFMWLKGILSFGVELFRKYNLEKKKKHNSIWKPNWFVFFVLHLVPFSTKMTEPNCRVVNFDDFWDLTGWAERKAKTWWCQYKTHTFCRSLGGVTPPGLCHWIMLRFHRIPVTISCRCSVLSVCELVK